MIAHRSKISQERKDGLRKVKTIHKEIEQVYNELRLIKDDMGRLTRFMEVTQKLNSLHQQWSKAFQEYTVGL